MGLFGKKAAVKEQETVTAEEEVRSLKEKLLPLRELGRSAIEQKDRLQNEEKVTIEGIDRVGASFELVEEKYQGISDSVTDFRTEFDNAREVTNHLDEIIAKLKETADESHAGMEQVDQSSKSVSSTIDEMQGVFDRRARFVCVVALVMPDSCIGKAAGMPPAEHFPAAVQIFEGKCEGRIAFERAGCGGFGYDPVFIPDAYPDRTLAEVDEDAKNAISHRGNALAAMVQAIIQR